MIIEALNYITNALMCPFISKVVMVLVNLCVFYLCLNEVNCLIIVS